MKRLVSIGLVWAIGVAPLWAQERKFNMNFDVNAAAARERASVPQAGSPSGADKAVFLVSLAAAVAGTVFEVKETNQALDKHFTVRSFPFVWIETNDPADKGKIDAYLAGTNAAIMGISTWAFVKHHTKAGILLNFFVAGLSTAVALNERHTINK
jgi:hypothetical protein